MKVRLILKGLEGLLVPNFFKNYGIDGDKLYGMYTALRDKGLEHFPSFMYAWQAMKETPKSYYAFGKKYNNVTDWATYSYEAMTGKRIGGTYKNAQNATNYNEWRSSMKSFNPRADYWNKWLPNGMEDAEKYINSRGYQKPAETNIESKINMEPEPIVNPVDKLRVEKPLVNVKRQGDSMLLINKFLPGGPVIKLQTRYDEAAKAAKASNQREATIASNYFSQAPTIPNLVKGAYHWFMSQPSLGGEDETPWVSKGTAPTFGLKASNAKQALLIVKAMKNAKLARTANQSMRIMQEAEETIRRLNNFDVKKALQTVDDIKNGRPFRSW